MHAGVAARSINLATTEQRVRGLVCWGAGGSRWKAQPVDPRSGPASSSHRRSQVKVVVDGLPLFGGCQLAVDTTLVCALHCDGFPHNGAADVVGVVLQAARRRKERIYAELVGPRTRGSFLAQLAKARSRVEPKFLRVANEVGSHLVLRSGQGCGRFFVRPEMRPRSGWRHSSQLGG